MPGTGVFVCSCGLNIARTVDVEAVVKEVSQHRGVKFATNYKYMCSDPGQAVIKAAIEEHDLDSVVIAACSPSLHEGTFRGACQSAGMNPYMCEIANIREQCSWVHQDDKEGATNKAEEIIASKIEKVRINEALLPITVPVTRRALVIGGGISGIEAALNIAESGYEAVLVERKPYIGGHMLELSSTYPSLECSPCILSGKIDEINRNPRIKVLTESKVESLEGYIGNFKATIRKRPTYVNANKCVSCGRCVEECPVSAASGPDNGSGNGSDNGSGNGSGGARAIYFPYTEMSSRMPVINKSLCKHHSEGCDVCVKVCPSNAIDFDQGTVVLEEDIGAVVVATGFELHPKDRINTYGGDKYADVIDGLQLERLLSAWQRDNVQIRRPSDGRIPKEVVFIQCAGSCDSERGLPYCSKVCCMSTAKQAMLYKQAVPDAQVYVFYTDIRAGGKGYEEFVQRGPAEEGTLYVRGKVTKVFEEDGKIVVWGTDSLADKQVEVQADMLVLATPMVPSEGARDLARTLRISSDRYGFFSEIHPKMRPVESPTAGIYLAGCAQAPRDITESIAHAAGAAGKVVALFSQEVLAHDPIVASVSRDLCEGCGICVEACPYGARELDAWTRMAKVTEVLCQGCGTCAAVCPNGACSQRNYTPSQVLNMIDAAL